MHDPDHQVAHIAVPHDGATDGELWERCIQPQVAAPRSELHQRRPHRHRGTCKKASARGPQHECHLHNTHAARIHRYASRKRLLQHTRGDRSTEEAAGAARRTHTVKAGVQVWDGRTDMGWQAHLRRPEYRRPRRRRSYGRWRRYDAHPALLSLASRRCAQASVPLTAQRFRVFR